MAKIIGHEPIMASASPMASKAAQPLGALIATMVMLSAPSSAEARYIDRDNIDVLCVAPIKARAADLRAGFESAWYDLDVHGRALGWDMNLHDANFGKTPLREGSSLRERADRYKVKLQQLMVLVGELFPHFNRPMDVPGLADRFATRSVPVFDWQGPEMKTALMENYLTDDYPENGSRGAAFVLGLGDLEDDALSLASGGTATDFYGHKNAFDKAFDDFMPALKQSIFSPSLETALERRLIPVCKAHAEDKRPRQSAETEESNR